MREFLTAGVHQAVKHPDPQSGCKEAFLASCYTGFRWCDVNGLKWEEIDANGDIIIKIENAYAIPYNTTIKTLNENYIHPVAGMTVLSAAGDDVENSFAAPRKDIRVTKIIANASKDLEVTVPPYSVSRIRLKTR